MGNAKARRMLNQQARWIDKSQPRHKHHFCDKVLVCLHMSSELAKYYLAVKCDKCNSFINATFISANDMHEQLPVINLCSPHKWIIGFTDAYLTKID